jgi:hypothetical protein
MAFPTLTVAVALLSTHRATRLKTSTLLLPSVLPMPIMAQPIDRRQLYRDRGLNHLDYKLRKLQQVSTLLPNNIPRKAKTHETFHK